MNTRTPTRYPGVYRLADNRYWIRCRTIDPRTGRKKEVCRTLTDVSPREASQKRSELIAAAQQTTTAAPRMRVGEYAKVWIESKKLRIDRSTARTYESAIESRIVPGLGQFFFDELTSLDVQKWVDDAMRHGWASAAKGSKQAQSATRRPYSPKAIAVWFRVLRTMTRDAMAVLNLPRDPTLRVSLPDRTFERREPNALSPAELVAFLAAMKRECPQQYGLVALLAYTGLRFCHASALRWEDWDENAGVLQVVRKNFRGELGPVSRKKQAPKEYPVEPQLADILREHRLDLQRTNNPGLAAGLMFPSKVGTLRTPNTLDVAFRKCLKAAGITKRFTVHGLRYTFTDLVRRAHVDAVVRRALTGHVTEEMQQHYSSVGLDEKRAAIAGVLRLASPEAGLRPTSSNTTIVGSPPTLEACVEEIQGLLAELSPEDLQRALRVLKALCQDG